MCPGKDGNPSLVSLEEAPPPIPQPDPPMGHQGAQGRTMWSGRLPLLVVPGRSLHPWAPPSFPACPLLIQYLPPRPLPQGFVGSVATEYYRPLIDAPLYTPGVMAEPRGCSNFTATVKLAESSEGSISQAGGSAGSPVPTTGPAQGELFTWRRTVFIAYYILFI